MNARTALARVRRTWRRRRLTVSVGMPRLGQRPMTSCTSWYGHLLLESADGYLSCVHCGVSRALVAPQHPVGRCTAWNGHLVASARTRPVVFCRVCAAIWPFPV